MAPETRAGARAYQEIKRAILSGELRQRQRLDIDELAARWRVSATPVRHALAVLTAERLVTAHVSRGYRVAFWSEAELAALYEWRWQLAGLGLDSFQGLPAETSAAATHADAVAGLIGALTACANEEVRRAALAADERLTAAYRVESEVLSHTGRELSALAETLSQGEVRRIQQRLKSFFRRRIVECAAIRARASVRALPRNGD